MNLKIATISHVFLIRTGPNKSKTAKEYVFANAKKRNVNLEA